MQCGMWQVHDACKPHANPRCFFDIGFAMAAVGPATTHAHACRHAASPSIQSSLGLWEAVLLLAFLAHGSCAPTTASVAQFEHISGGGGGRRQGGGGGGATGSAEAGGQWLSAWAACGGRAAAFSAWRRGCICGGGRGACAAAGRRVGPGRRPV